MFGIGLPELIFILALALIVLGPERLPQVARQVARFVNDLKRAADDFKEQVESEALGDLKELEKLTNNDLTDADDPASAFSKKIDTLEKAAKMLDISQADRQPGGLGPEWKPASGPEESQTAVEKGQEDEGDVTEATQGPDPVDPEAAESSKEQ